MARPADYTPTDFATTVLRRLKIKPTPEAVQAMVGWQQAEGGNWHNQAKYNPLNTTQPMPGAGNTGSQGNIKVYRDWGQGVDATVQTLANQRYAGIRKALAAGDPRGVASAIDASPWGTHGQLIYNTISGAKAGTPGQIIPGSSQDVASSSRTSIASSLGNVAGSTVDAPSQPSAIDVIRQYRANTQPRQPITLGVQPQVPSLGQSPTGYQGSNTLDFAKRLAAMRDSHPNAAVTLETGDVGAAPSRGNVPREVSSMIETANKLDVLNNQGKLPYVWGGGHGTDWKHGLDCSGAVSMVTGIDPRVAAQFMNWGEGGQGKSVTIWAKSSHVLMEINGHFFGTSGANPEGGAGWIPRSKIPAGYLKGFVPRHPRGL